MNSRRKLIGGALALAWCGSAAAVLAFPFKKRVAKGLPGAIGGKHTNNSGGPIDTHTYSGDAQILAIQAIEGGKKVARGAQKGAAITAGVVHRVIRTIEDAIAYRKVPEYLFPGPNRVNLRAYESSYEMAKINELKQTFGFKRSVAGFNRIDMGNGEVLLVARLGKDIGHPATALGVVGYAKRSDLEHGDLSDVHFRPITSKAEQNRLEKWVNRALAPELDTSFFRKTVPVIFKRGTVEAASANEIVVAPSNEVRTH